jgi:hypothetical protein
MSPNSAPAGADAIVIGEQSNVCVSVRVDPRVWPTPPLPAADQNFSTFFAGEMERLYRGRSGAHAPPASGPGPRFVSNPTGTNPLCREPGRDIHVTITYGPQEDGQPFVFAYRLEQGSAVRSGSATRDIAEEWRSGRLARVHKQQPLQAAISDDMRVRAAFLIRTLARED